MKFLKVFSTVIISIALIIMIFALSMTFILKKVFQEEVLVGMAKNAIVDKYIEGGELNLTIEQREVVKRILDDKAASGVLNMILDNYLAYSVLDDYNMSKKDYNTLIKFILRHVDDIDKVSDKKIDKEYIKNNLTYEEINKMAKDGFEIIDSEGGMELSEENIKAINAYAFAVSDELRSYLYTGIGIAILLLMLVNWSVITWMLPAGVSLIMSGTFVNMIYLLTEFLKDVLSTDADVGKYIVNINMSYTALIGISEFVLGIVLIIIKNKINKAEIKENIA